MEGVDGIIKILINGLVTITSPILKKWDESFKFINSRKNQSTQNSRDKMLRGWITTILFIAVLFIIIRFKFVYLIALQLRVNILGDLSEIAQKDDVLRKDLIPLYEGILQDLSKGRVSSMEIFNLSILVTYLQTFILSPLLWKFVSGAGLGIILILWTIFANRKRKERIEAFRGATLITFIFGVIGLLIPIFFPSISLALNILINFVILLIIQLIILLWIGRNRLSPVRN